MYKCTIANDVKENAKSSSQFHLISCIYIIFINMEKQESQFLLVITVLRKWVRYGKYQIKQKFKPVAEIELKPIMDAYRCMYEDVE